MVFPLQALTSADVQAFSFRHYIDRIVQNARLIDTTDKVVITSIHKAKGLEFDCVIMPELVKDKFPAKRSENIESERRIYYVGLTRAKKALYLVGGDDTDKVIRCWGYKSKKLPKSYKSSEFLYEGKYNRAQNHGCS